MLAGGLDAPKSALAGLITALGVAVFGFGMPVSAAVASAGYGACFELLPIGWIVVAAVCLFQLTVKSGHFEIVKRSVVALSPDRWVQALLIAFCFGTFIVVAAVATGQRGGEAKILRFVFLRFVFLRFVFLRFVFLHSVVLAALVGALTMAQAYVLTWMIPG